MKMVKHLFEGASDDKVKNEITLKMEENRQVIDKVDNLLESRKNEGEINDDLAVMIVKIISCFNSISNRMDEEKVKKWIADFSKLMIASAAPGGKKGSQSSYMEQYVYVLELLVTKNLDKIDINITMNLLEIYKSETKYFSKTIWYKMLKILAHLLYL